MCGRYALRTPWQRIAEYFGIPIADVPELFAARYNVAPTQQVLAVRQDPVGRNASYLKWGFIPSWSKDGKIAPINAMSETAADKPMYLHRLPIERAHRHSALESYVTATPGSCDFVSRQIRSVPSPFP
jgi:putative SOS response-associated peptidase YedK